MTRTLEPLPYPIDALQPYITARTLEFHYGKHHQAYLTNLNKLIEGTNYASFSLEETILKSFKEQDLPIFNNAAQLWNHTFYWNCMTPNGGGEPSGPLLERIGKDFGGYAAFREAFKQAAVTQFGSGWAWLVLKDGGLSIMKTGNADTPMCHGAKALLTCDVWEHAYYLDFQNRRADYVDQFLDHLVNWKFVLAQLN